MMKFLVLFILMFLSSMALGATPEIAKLDNNLSDALDDVIDCTEISLPAFGGMSNNGAKQFGHWLMLTWARSGYYNDYIYPLLDTVKARVQQGEAVNYRDLEQYETILAMTKFDAEFKDCPKNTGAFLSALDARVEAEIPGR